MNMMNKCAKFHKDSPSGKKIKFNLARAIELSETAVLCTTLYRNRYPDNSAKDRSVNDTSAKPGVRMPTVRRDNSANETKVRRSSVRRSGVRMRL